MKSWNSKLRNLFCPFLSTTFVLIKYSDIFGESTEEESKGDAKTNDSEVLACVIDSVKLNMEYKALLQVFEIEELDNTQALKMIESKIPSYCSNNTIQRLMFDPDEMFNWEIKKLKISLRAGIKNRKSLENIQVIFVINCTEVRHLIKKGCWMNLEIQSKLRFFEKNRFSVLAKRRVINDNRIQDIKNIDNEMRINHCDYVTLRGSMEEKWEESKWFDIWSYSQDETTYELQKIKRSSTNQEHMSIFVPIVSQ